MFNKKPKLKDLTITDIPEITTLDSVCFQEGIAFDEQTFLSFLSYEPIIKYKITENRKIIAFIICPQYYADSVTIATIDVHPDHRRKGYGQLLLDKVIEVCKKLDIYEIELQVHTENEKAINFYKKNEFQIENIIKNYYKNGMDAYTMTKKLL